MRFVLALLLLSFVCGCGDDRDRIYEITLSDDQKVEIVATGYWLRYENEFWETGDIIDYRFRSHGTMAGVFKGKDVKYIRMVGFADEN